MPEMTADFLDKEIAEHTKTVEDRQNFIIHLQKEIENANNDRNAAYGAMQQCIKIKNMIFPPKLEIKKEETKEASDVK